MLPPVEESVLQNNPEFAVLYNTLTTAILNPDGTTKKDPAAKEREAIRKELDAHRLKSARQHLLVQAISTATPPEPKTSSRRAKPQARSESSSELPEPLLDLLLLLPPLLTSGEHLSPESMELLLSNPPFSSLESLLPDLASLASSNLHSSAVLLARIANPTTNPSFLHRSIPSLPSHIEALASANKAEKTSLAKARLAAANALIELLEKHAQALALLVRALEAKHGGVARSLEFRAAETSLAAQHGEVDTETALWNARKDVYSPEISTALRNYARHLKDGQVRLREAVRTKEDQLEEYGVATGEGGGQGDKVKERTMREIARVYRDMRRQMDEVKGDLRRLR